MLKNKKFDCTNGHIIIDEFDNYIQLDIKEAGGDSVIFTIDSLKLFIDKLKNINELKSVSFRFYHEPSQESQTLNITVSDMCLFSVKGRGKGYSYNTVLIMKNETFENFVKYFVDGEYVDMIVNKYKFINDYEQNFKNLKG